MPRKKGEASAHAFRLKYCMYMCLYVWTCVIDVKSNIIAKSGMWVCKSFWWRPAAKAQEVRHYTNSHTHAWTSKRSSSGVTFTDHLDGDLMIVIFMLKVCGLPYKINPLKYVKD